MHENIQGRPKLLIVSDTWMWRTPSDVVVHEPTLREVEAFSIIFKTVRWIGYEMKTPVIRNAKSSKANNVELILLRASGGNSLLSKLSVLLILPKYIFLIMREIKNADVVHTRGPSVPALIAVIISFLYRKKLFWNKYAGNWGDPRAGSYKLQKYLLKKSTFSKVTINGKWEGQEPHILTFLNPCLYEEEIKKGRETAINKTFKDKLCFCFVGRIERQKGVGKIVEAFKLLGDSSSIGKVWLIGDGTEKEYFEGLSRTIKNGIVFLGSLERRQLNEVYANAHFILLPSVSEGFPKVIPEAVSFGCIPIISKIQSLMEFIKEGESGFILEKNSSECLADKIRKVIVDKESLRRIMQNAVLSSEEFTYSAYIDRIKTEILNEHIKN